jgi:hypothetical protein
MGSQEITHNSWFYISLGVEVLAVVVLLVLVVVGIVIAIRAKTGPARLVALSWPLRLRCNPVWSRSGF